MAIPTFDVSPKGIQFIANLESFRDLPYKDPGGDGHWVIGYGTEFPDADLPHYQGGISKGTGMFLLSKHNEPLQKQLAKTTLVSLLQHQRDAIFSLVYNIGYDEFINKSTIYHHLLMRNTDLSPWRWYNEGSHKQVMDGLKRRRELELRLFIYGNYNTD